MSYTALYRRFRPNDFSEVKGQDAIVTTLKNQIRLNRTSHAYLFTGTRGTGKTSVAKIMAKAVNCSSPTENGPCGECEVCRAISSGTSMNVFEIDAASNNGVDNIRDIIDELSYPPTMGKYKVYIIDEVHMLSTGAFNALLKSLEEPPEYVLFILATTEVHKIPITILSRCQRFDFRRISTNTIYERLNELILTDGLDAEEKALRYIAKCADGSMRDSLSLLDQCLAFNIGKKLTFEAVLDVLGAVDTEIFSKLLNAITEKNIPALMSTVNDVLLSGRELTQFVNDFTVYLRNILLLVSCDAPEEAIDLSSEAMERLKKDAASLDGATLLRYIRIFSELHNQIRYDSNKRILVEIALIKLATPQMETDTQALLQRIKDLEKTVSELSAGGVVAPKPATEVKESPKTEPKKLEVAVSEDLQGLIRNWNMFLETLKDTSMRLYFAVKDAGLSTRDGKVLDIHLTNSVASGTLITGESAELQKETLSQCLNNFLGKEFGVEIFMAGSKEEFESNHADLFKNVNMFIETEEDE